MINEALAGDDYEPPEDLREIVEAVQNADVEYHNQEEYEVAGDPARQTDHSIEFREDSVDVTETIASVGVLSSYTGSLRLTAAVILAQAVQWGEPTQIYADEAVDGEYADVTAEWYVEPAIEAGVPEARLADRDGLEADHLNPNLLEDLVRTGY